MLIFLLLTDLILDTDEVDLGND